MRENIAQGMNGQLIRCMDGKIRFRPTGSDVMLDLLHYDLSVTITDSNASVFGNRNIDYPSEWTRNSLRRYEKFIGQYTRGKPHLGVFSPSEVLPFKTEGMSKRRYTAFNGKTYEVNMDSQRYFVFSESLNCIDCGLRGEVMFLDGNNSKASVANQTSAHFNLYGLNKDMELVMLTKDHLKPRSKGGKDVLSNYITMCEHCNQLKGSKYEGLLQGHLRDWDIDL